MVKLFARNVIRKRIVSKENQINMKTKSQKEIIKEQLRANGYVSRNWALDNFISRLGAIIADLKKEGFVFKANYDKGNYEYHLVGVPMKKVSHVDLVEGPDGKIKAIETEKYEKKYNIPIKYDAGLPRENDHEDRVAIFFASDYMKDHPIPKYVPKPKVKWSKAMIAGFIGSLLP